MEEVTPTKFYEVVLDRDCSAHYFTNKAEACMYLWMEYLQYGPLEKESYKKAWEQLYNSDEIEFYGAIFPQEFESLYSTDKN